MAVTAILVAAWWLYHKRRAARNAGSKATEANAEI